LNHAKKIKILIGLISISITALFFVDPVPQDLTYHQFADRNSLGGIPNFWNVISNLPFILAGLLGLVGLRRVNLTAVTGLTKALSLLFYVGLLLTGFGSGYYHLNPANETLVWDRLPMTIAFMAFFCFVISIHISERAGRVLLWPLITVGIASVFYWAYTESIGEGDLRFYAVIQFLPMLLIPAIVLMFPSSAYNAIYIWAVIALYIAAKLGEHFDYQIYELLSLSGHSFKHVIAAFSGLAFFYALKSVMASKYPKTG